MTEQKQGPEVRVSEGSASDTQGFLNSVTSFFNTIAPTGIIIHHSGVIPADRKTSRR